MSSGPVFPIARNGLRRTIQCEHDGVSLAFCVANVAGLHASDTLTNERARKMCKAGPGSSVIVATIEKSATAGSWGVRLVARSSRRHG